MKKIMVGTKAFPLLISIMISGMGFSFAQKQDKLEKQIQKEQETKEMIALQRFVFLPQSVTSLKGGARILTPDFALTVKKDTIESYLPYYGRVYNPPISATGDGWNFRSTHFEYKVSELKKGGWNISIKLKDASDGRSLDLNINKSGYATLQISSVDRETISYYGYLAKIK